LPFGLLFDRICQVSKQQDKNACGRYFRCAFSAAGLPPVSLDLLADVITSLFDLFSNAHFDVDTYDRVSSSIYHGVVPDTPIRDDNSGNGKPLTPSQGVFHWVEAGTIT